MRDILLVPGPTPLPERVRGSMFRDVISHRGKEFGALLSGIQEKIKKVFMTSRPVYIFPGTGTGVLECALFNLFKQGEKILSVSNGVFAERWAEIARRMGLDLDVIDFPYGSGWDLNALEKKLKSAVYSGILLTHNETSTGVLNPLRKAVFLIRRILPETVICVDAVSSLGGAPLKMDEWGIDAVLTASQKALMTPPGLAFVAISERAFKKAQTISSPSYYWDIKLADDYLRKEPMQTPYTPAVSLLYALDVALDFLLEEGLEESWKRHNALARFVRTGLREMGFEILPPEECASPTVSAVKIPEEIGFSHIKESLAKKNIVIAGGQGRLKGKIFRVAHMGYVGKNEMVAFLHALKEVVEGV